MPTYISLTRFPPDILRSLTEFPGLLNSASEQAAKATGCQIVGSWLTLGLGPYDHVAVLDAPDEAAAVRFTNIGVSVSGVDATLLRGFTVEEAVKLLGTS